jgi:hypothetical protein
MGNKQDASPSLSQTPDTAAAPAPAAAAAPAVRERPAKPGQFTQRVYLKSTAAVEAFTDGQTHLTITKEPQDVDAWLIGPDIRLSNLAAIEEIPS